jgi:8-oxo-dGTP diphosphatase
MNHFCLMCGTKLEPKTIEGINREICPHCGWIYYEILKVSAGVRIEKEERLLLVQRGINPWFGKWYMPAGFVEVNEEPYQGAIREAFEETGLHVSIKNLVDIYTYTDDPRGNGVVMLYDADIVGGELSVTPETLAAGFFSAEEIVEMEFAGATVKKEIDDWLAKKGQSKR